MKKKTKTIALIAHDHKKHDMVNWAIQNKSILEKYTLCGTGTTAGLVAEATGLDVKGYLVLAGIKCANPIFKLNIFFGPLLNGF